MTDQLEALGFDPDTVATWMTQNGILLDRPLLVERIGDGESNITCLARDTIGREWVLRRPPLGPRLDTAHDVAREFRVLHALDGQRVPVPRALGLIDDASVCSAPILIMSRVEGLVVRDRRSFAGFSTSARRRSGPAMIEALAALHSVDLEIVGLDRLASTAPYAERQVKRWARQAENGSEPAPPLMLDLAERLRTHAPAHQETVLVHGDCHLLNVLLHENGDVAALLDWELSTLGDPIADLGTLLAYWPNANPEPGLGPFDDCHVPELAHPDDLVAHYAAVSGRQPRDLGYWSALASWKIAVIAKGVLERSLASDAPESTEIHFRRQIDTMLTRSDASLSD